jgi:hypothetical protein
MHQLPGNAGVVPPAVRHHRTAYSGVAAAGVGCAEGGRNSHAHVFAQVDQSIFFIFRFTIQ